MSYPLGLPKELAGVDLEDEANIIKHLRELSGLKEKQIQHLVRTPTQYNSSQNNSYFEQSNSCIHFQDPTSVICLAKRFTFICLIMII